METITLDDMTITVNRKGANDYTKVSFPLRYGAFTEIKTADYLFQFNLNGEIKFIRGVGPHWPEPNEWLKRTVRDEWVYYFSGGYRGVDAYMGEFYLPCLMNADNPVLKVTTPYREIAAQARRSLEKLIAALNARNGDGLSPTMAKALRRIKTANGGALKLKAYRFNKILGGSIPVLPPDARHVDYDVIPIIIADGCTYNCAFCSVKTGREFRARAVEDVKRQIAALADFYADDLKNYNSLFLGQNDALNAGLDLITTAARQAYKDFDFQNSNMTRPRLFLFGSISSFAQTDAAFLKAINHLPYYTYINIGLESFDQATLDQLKKPVTADSVEKAFFRMAEINQTYPNIEMTSNFVLGDELPDTHIKTFKHITGEKLARHSPKGAVYMSPLSAYGPRLQLQKQFIELKNYSKLPTYIYLIQHL